MNTTQVTAQPLELRRSALLDRFHRARPKIVAIVAAAGFGKTTFARQLIAADTKAVVCDCTGVRDDLGLARRIIAALGLHKQELSLGDGGATIAERLHIALGAWRETTCNTFVFESAEDIILSESAREFFGQVLNERPDGRTIVICTRENLRFHLTRYAAPHEIMVVRGRDLALDMTDLRAIFGTDATDESLLRVHAVSQGWPIAVLLLHRFWSEGRASELLERLDDIAFEQLHDYLADEVLAGVEPRIVDGLFAIAAVPDASAVDIRVATGDPRIVTDITELARQSAFISRSSTGIFDVHPLLGALLLEGASERRIALLRAMASGYEGQHQYIRAAQLYHASGDERKAAQALSRYEPFNDHSLPRPYVHILSSLDRSIVLRFPRLWGMTAMLRSFYVDFQSLLDEAQLVWRTLAHDAPTGQRSYVFLCRVIFMGHLGRYDEARVMLDEFMRRLDVSDRPSTAFESYVYYVRAVILARIGRFVEAEADLTAALPLIDTTDLAGSASYVLLGADIARPRGERAVERQCLDRALERARATEAPNFIAFALAECTMSAWLDGDESAFAKRAAELEDTVVRYGVKGFAVIAAASRGRVIAPSKADVARTVAFGRLMSIEGATSDARAVQLASDALTAAKASCQPYVQTLAHIAMALTDDDSFVSSMRLARDAAAQCEAPNLHEAVDAIAERRIDCGALSTFVARLTRAREERVAPVDVQIVTGTVSVNGAPLMLATRELELIVALALKREATSRSRLAAMLWPDVDETSARNALSVCLHRLRTHVGRDDVIVRDGDGYRIHPDANVDLWEIERTMALIRGRDRLAEADRDALCRTWQRLRTTRPARMEQWEWFSPTERRLGEFRMELGHRLGEEALERGAPLEALEFANDMIAFDSCDEPARELAIRAYLQLDDKAAASRQFRQYRDTLMSELQCEPSSALRELVGL